MDTFREKIEKLKERIDETEYYTEQIKEKIGLSKEHHTERVLEIEDLKRSCHATREIVNKNQEKLKKNENELKHFQTLTAQNDIKINKLQQKEDLREDETLITEQKISNAKHLHMTLSGKFEDARSRKKLLESELKKVINMLNNHERRREELLRTLSKDNTKISELTESKDKSNDFEEHAISANRRITQNIQIANSKQRIARHEITSLEMKITKYQTEIEEVKRKREDTNKELKHIIDELDNI